MPQAVAEMVPAPRKLAERPRPLSDEDVATRLLDRPRAVIDEVHAFAKERLEGEAKRQAAVEAKATSLLSTAGVGMTITVAFSGNVLLSRTALGGLPSWAFIGAAGAAFFAIVCGLLAAGMAVVAVRIRSYMVVNERNVLDPGALAKAGEPDGIAGYRARLTIEFLRVAEHNFKEHQRTATWVKRGQVCLLLFVALLIVAAVLVGGGAAL